jgi:iron complex transport system ATP-binding protein
VEVKENPIIIIDNLQVQYDNRVVIHDLSCKFEQGKITFLLGKNGSGKSTLLKSIMGILPYDGRITIDNKNNKSLHPKQRSKLIGYLSQSFEVAFPYTVFDMVLMGRANEVFLNPSKADTEKVIEALGKLNIAHLSSKIFNELSGGERQMVLMARTLVQNPKVLLLDEPLSHLDIFYQQKLLLLFKQLTAEGLTVIATIHDPTQALLFGEQFLFLKKGQLIFHHDNNGYKDVEFLEKIFDYSFDVFSFEGRSIFLPKII